MVIHALRLITGDGDLDRLAPRLFDSDARARGAAMEVLEASCPPAWRAPLLALVEDRGADLDAQTSARLGAPAADPVEELACLTMGARFLVTICGLAEDARPPPERAPRSAQDPRRSLAGAGLPRPRASAA